MARDARNVLSDDSLRTGGMSRRAVLGRAAAIGAGAAVAAPLIHRRTAAQEKVQIRLATWAGQEEAAELQQVIDPINQASTTFEIVSEPSPADYYTKLQTTIAGGTAADLFWLSQEYVAGYRRRRRAARHHRHRLAEDQSPAANLEDYFPGILQTAQYDGRTYGLPWISQPVMLYYNPALFDAAGIAYPDDTWTWDTFKEAAAAMTDPAAGVYGTAFNGWPPIQMFIWQAGGEVIIGRPLLLPDRHARGDCGRPVLPGHHLQRAVRAVRGDHRRAGFRRDGQGRKGGDVLRRRRRRPRLRPQEGPGQRGAEGRGRAEGAAEPDDLRLDRPRRRSTPEPRTRMPPTRPWSR